MSSAGSSSRCSASCSSATRARRWRRRAADGALPRGYVCVRCRAGLSAEPSALRCVSCAAIYPVEDGIADFSGGLSWDDFVAGQELSGEHRAGLDQEVSGAVSRIQGFYLPLLRSFVRQRGPARPLRVLDCGCGNGLSVDLLNEAGLDAWGNDLSKLRRWQWKERRFRERLSLAGGASLPFPDRFFDALICSGVLEHIGVRETGGETYRVAPLPARDAAREAFLGELLRVLTPGGRLWLDFPNGAFPLDFWHGPRAGAARFHGPTEGFLPTVREVRSAIARIGPDWRVQPLSPHRRLRFEQVGRHWYGRLLRGPAALFLAAMAAPGLRWLAGTPVNPYLVLEIARSPSRSRDKPLIR